MCVGRLGEQPFNKSRDLVLELLISRRISWTSESGMNLANSPVSSQDEGGRPAVEMVGLRDLFVELIRGPSYEDGIGDAVTLDEGAEAYWILQLVLLFKAEVYNLEALAMELFVEALKEGRLIVAVRAPGTTNGDDNDLVTELGIGVRDLFA